MSWVSITGKSGMSMSHVQHTPASRRNVLVPTRLPYYVANSTISARVFARLRSFAYNIRRRNQTSTFNQDRHAAALGGVNALLKWTFS